MSLSVATAKPTSTEPSVATRFRTRKYPHSSEIDGTIVPIREHHEHTTEEQRHPDPLNVQWKIPRSDCSTVLRLIDDSVSLCQIVSYYKVSYKMVQNITLVPRQEGMDE